jgi:hypothetical protein
MRASFAWLLPPPCSTMGTAIASNVDILDFLAHAIPQIFHDVKNGEVASHVVRIVNAIVWKVAGSSPVSGHWG